MKMQLANMITGFRAILIPFIYESLITTQFTVCLLLYSIALFSDIIDGYIARQTGSASPAGAFFDGGVDFLLVFTGIMGFTTIGLLNFWVLGVFILVFCQFFIGVRSRTPVYDPTGKLFGIYSLMLVPLILIFPSISIFYVETSILILGSASILGRKLYLHYLEPKRHLKVEWSKYRNKSKVSF